MRVPSGPATSLAYVFAWPIPRLFRGVCPGSGTQSDGVTGLDWTDRKGPEKNPGITEIIMEINDLRKKGRKQKEETCREPKTFDFNLYHRNRVSFHP